MTHFSKSPLRRAFSLIELLVVIAILSLLAAILFPVFGQARERARQSSCLSNLNQMGRAFTMYLQDYDEQTPANWVQTGSKSPSLSSDQAWPLMIYPYVKNREVFDCPSSPDYVTTSSTGGFPFGLASWDASTTPVEGWRGKSSYDGKYLFNYDGLTYGINNNIADLQKPAETFAFLDGGDMICCAGTNNYDNLLEELDINLKGTNAWSNYNKENAFRHLGRANVAFADGHAKNVKWEDVLTRKADL
ncbi:MAG TPA: prepilin-type N-terminal cleavage/methylation domain-containing protein, partial [Abditibacteriaceae bacterium]